MKQPGECVTKNPSDPRGGGIICCFTAEHRQCYHPLCSPTLVLRMKTVLAWVEAWTGALFPEHTLRLHISGWKASPLMQVHRWEFIPQTREVCTIAQISRAGARWHSLQALNTGDDPNAINTKYYKRVFGSFASKILTVNKHQVDLYVLTCNAACLSKTARQNHIYDIIPV